MSRTEGPTPQHVVAFYDNTEAVDLFLGDEIHMGHWSPGDTSPLRRAQERLTDLVTERTGAGPGRHVLDVGCGTGGPARRLVRGTGATLTGITISPEQARVARVRNAEAGFGGGICVGITDAVATPFADGVFDAAIAIESILHIPDKQGAFGEIARVLRPGAPLVVADFAQRTAEGAVSGAPGSLAASFVAVPTWDAYTRLAEGAGLHVEEILDITDGTQQSYARILEGLTRPELVAVCGPEQRTAIEGILRLFADATDAGLLGYVIVVARKPAG